MVKLVQALPEDEIFLLEVYAGGRAEEMRDWGWSTQEKEEFLRLQYRFQAQAYRMRYPGADCYLIWTGKQRAGRLMAARTAEAIILLDISLLPVFRNQGIGTSILKALQNESAATRKPVALSVMAANPARVLYERLGFQIVQQSDAYLRMAWVPQRQNTNLTEGSI